MQRDETGDFLGMTLHRLLMVRRLQRFLLFHSSQGFLVLLFSKYVVYTAVLLLLKLFFSIVLGSVSRESNREKRSSALLVSYSLLSICSPSVKSVPSLAHFIGG